ncbi:SRPBCC family protein [Pseudomonas sp. HR1]|uniref:SRPBCC family protein n=1 Tax=Pseudomonas TaxID=286 RepID=UPI0005CB6707|nr:MULTISPECIES: SRPBCC family protein [Pseudomonas]KIZ49720.1 cyclase/dehydrase [Pseudomonas oryzihabitans]KTT52601.1 cyclase/dehydrase [Pseudomonas psychrotolerans]MBA1257714.1 SRPBCC family protein [Pseudomonas psychrotolerans]MDK4200276.1 SRPBCC family protein [Pseudomonas sp. HR1]MDU4056958.1 SRPBCC family protein [Pseudomonas oryzihabitans]
MHLDAPTPPLAPPPRDAAAIKGVERLASVAGGGLLISRGLARGGLLGLLTGATGAWLLKRGLRGHCSIKSTLTKVRFERDVRRSLAWHSAASQTRRVVIARPRDELYRFWRDFSNLPIFMRHIERVDVLNDRYSHWVVKAPMGRFEWDAEVTDDIPGQLIGWRSCGYAGLNNLGWVSFADVPGGTEVTAVMAYEPPAGRLGHLFARLLRRDPGTRIAQDLAELKILLERAHAVGDRYGAVERTSHMESPLG